jgi:hypothetical protein
LTEAQFNSRPVAVLVERLTLVELVTVVFQVAFQKLKDQDI